MISYFLQQYHLSFEREEKVDVKIEDDLVPKWIFLYVVNDVSIASGHSDKNEKTSFYVHLYFIWY